MNIYIIYKLLFPNGKIYIGQTKDDFNSYMNKYKSNVYNKNRKGYDRLLNRAIRKHGWENVKKEILFTVSEEFVDELEIKMIAEYKSADKRFGYNIESGGNKNKEGYWKDKKRPEHSKRMIGKNNPFYNKNHSIVNRKKISESNKNKKRTKEFIENIRNINSVAIIKLDKNFNLLEKYISVREASRKTKIDISSISKCLHNKRNFAGGFVWRYAC